MNTPTAPVSTQFSGYQKVVVGMLAFLQFAVILDFMLMSPLGAVILAIATDLFPPQMRGRVMGFIQTAFAASQVLGIPIGIYLSARWNWHVPFLALVALGVLGGLLIAVYMKPVADHLKVPQEHSAFNHLRHTVTEPRYLLSFVSVLFLATGGFMLMPFSSAFTVNNLGISLHDLPIIYLVTGIATIFVGPLVGKAADAFGKLRVFFIGTALTIIMVLIYTNLSSSTLVIVTVINVVLFIGIFSRMIPFQALMSQVPVQTQRGSFNAINASISQLAGVWRRWSPDTSSSKGRMASSITTTLPAMSSSRRRCSPVYCCGAFSAGS
jgi:predicted MFS family arabinose efflux permease